MARSYIENKLAYDMSYVRAVVRAPSWHPSGVCSLLSGADGGPADWLRALPCVLIF